jgi:anti-sigma B factor antagonist
VPVPNSIAGVSVDPHLSLSTDHAGESVVVRAVGEVDMVTAPDLDRALTIALADACGTDGSAGKTLVADLAGITFFSSSGLSVLVHAHQRSADTGVALQVVAPSGSPARRAITALALHQLLTLRENPVEV